MLSLALVLRALRAKGATAVPLWADAVCINLSDTRERAVQMPMIQYIFGRAQRVVAWLVPEDDGSAEAVEVIRGRGKGVVGEGAWRGVNALLRRRLFERTWNVQELVLAPKVVMMCGTRSEIRVGVLRHGGAAGLGQVVASRSRIFHCAGGCAVFRPAFLSS